MTNKIEFRKIDLNPEKVRTALNLFHPGDHLFEIRVIKKGSRVYSAYFKDIDSALKNLTENRFPSGAQVYFTFNTLNPVCGCREQMNRFVPGVDATGDSDVVKYEWLMIDLDPERPKGVSSSDSELNLAISKAKTIKTALSERGFSSPVEAISGNGMHLFYKVNYEVTEENKSMTRSFLNCLSAQFSDDAINVDSSVFKPAQATKLYGTKTHKGSDTEDRPHRYSEITCIPESIQITDISAIQKYIADNAPKQNTGNRINRPSSSNERFDVEGFLNRHGIDYKVKSEPGKIRFEDIICPFCDNPGAGVVQEDSGKIGFNCFHNSCDGKTWKDFRAFYEPGYDSPVQTFPRHSSGAPELNVDNVTEEDLINPDYLLQFMTLDEYNQVSIKNRLSKKAKECRCQVAFNNAWSVANGRSLESDLPEYIEAKGKGLFVNTDLLQKAFSDNNRLLRAKDSSNGTVLLFVYEDGVYHELLRDDLKGLLIGMIQNVQRGIDYTKSVNQAVENLFVELDNVIDIEELNSDERIINFQNGILNLDTMELTPHSPDYYSTIQIPVKWIEGEPPKTPVFDRYLHDLTSGDESVIHLIMQVIGGVLSNVPGYKFKKGFMLKGSGDTGKSVIFNFVARMVGKRHTCITSLQNLEERFGTSDLFCKRFAGDPEMKFARVDEIKYFKTITGGDPIRMERKHGAIFNSTYKGFLWFNCNNLPLFGGDKGEHVYERFIIVPCNNVIPKERQDGDILEKMLKEKDGIVRKCVELFKDTIRKTDAGTKYSFDIPDVCRREVIEYMKQNSSAILFLDTCCIGKGSFQKDDNKGESTSQIYQAYRVWCMAEGIKVPESVRAFKQQISAYLRVPEKDLTHKSHGTEYYPFRLYDESNYYKILKGSLNVGARGD